MYSVSIVKILVPRKKRTKEGLKWDQGAELSCLTCLLYFRLGFPGLKTMCKLVSDWTTTMTTVRSHGLQGWGFQHYSNSYN